MRNFQGPMTMLGAIALHHVLVDPKPCGARTVFAVLHAGKRWGFDTVQGAAIVSVPIDENGNETK